MKLATSAHSFLFSNRPHSGECGIVDKLSWQRGESNHFPPDVRVWEGTKREVREGGEQEKKQMPPLPVPLLYMKSSTPPSLRLPIPPPPLHCWILPLPALSRFYTFCLSLYPRRQPGQAVFTAEVIGVVWREPDPGPAKA